MVSKQLRHGNNVSFRTICLSLGFTPARHEGHCTALTQHRSQQLSREGYDRSDSLTLAGDDVRVMLNRVIPLGMVDSLIQWLSYGR